MATKVYTEEQIEFQDGTEATLRPVNIKTMRKFMVYMDRFAKSENEDEGLECLLDASALCVSKEHPKYWDEKKKNTSKNEKGEEVSLPEGGHTEDWEEVADMPTVYKILDACGGVKLNDPNLLAAALQATGATTE